MAAGRALSFCLRERSHLISQFTKSIRTNNPKGSGTYLKEIPKRVSARAGWCLVAGSVPFVPTVHAFWGKKTEEAPPPAPSPVEKMIEKADELYAENRINDLYELLLASKDEPIADIQWRFGRAAYEKSKLVEKADEKKQLIYQAYEVVQSALKLDDNSSPAHKWFAILLDTVGELEGTKQRITNAFKVKEHFMRAIELNQSDATSVHLLGYWCFMFADMPWMQRKIASVIFASPPTSSYQEALEYFEKAEEIEPNFYSKNLMMIGKTYLRMGDKAKAKEFLQRTLSYPVKTEDDKTSVKEAQDLLK